MVFSLLLKKIPFINIERDFYYKIFIAELF